MNFRRFRGTAAAATALLAVLCAAAIADITWNGTTGWQKSTDGTSLAGGKQFDKAFALYVNGKYSRARKLFEKAAKKGEEPIVEDAKILIGECQLGDRNYRQAFKAFEEFLDAYPASRYVDRAYAGELEAARALLRGAKSKALGLRIWPGRASGEKMVDKITRRRPFSDYARDAQIELADAYYRKKLFIESASAYQQYVELYREGPDVQRAFLGVGKSILRDAQGPVYTPLPYYKAQSVFDGFVRQYGESPDAAEARKLSARSGEKLAEHYLGVAKWYLKMGQVEAARTYFNKVATEYGGTKWAEQATSYLVHLAPKAGGADAS